MTPSTILLTDSTLRDGNHALSHQLNKEQLKEYSRAADSAGLWAIEVGHGNGLGSSSLQVGMANLTDEEMLKIARSQIKKSKLCVHVIPGFATINRDLSMAIDQGVDIFRIASHCTEADITRNHIEFCRKKDKIVYGVLMMSHMADWQTLVSEAKKIESYGALGIILMDSAGSYTPDEVREKIQRILEEVSIPVGFHAHQNLGLGVSNSLTAVDAGAVFIDGCARGIGAGAGNTPIELLVAIFQKLNRHTGVDLKKICLAADYAENYILTDIPRISSANISSGLNGVFSGFLKPVNRISKDLGIDPSDVFDELGKRKVVAGQEDIILEVANDLLKKN